LKMHANVCRFFHQLAPFVFKPLVYKYCREALARSLKITERHLSGSDLAFPGNPSLLLRQLHGCS